MADETNPQSSTEETNSDSTESQEESSGASTLEEVEAYWRKRMSNSDKAHAAQTKELRERLERLEGSAQAGQQSGGEADAAQSAAMRELAQRVEQAERRAKQMELKAEFPLAYEAVGDGAAHIQRDLLASLNERLDFERTVPRIDPNNPPRPKTGPKPVSEMSIEEVQDYLRTLPYETP